MLNIIKNFLNPPQNLDLSNAQNIKNKHLPTLWLLGKTGAGKSSLIHCITGIDKVEIGSGFTPCTMTLLEYSFPEKHSIMRFLDTRGLGESGYDPKEDIMEASRSSNALVIVMRADDPEQSSVINTLKEIKQSAQIKQVMVVHTGVKINGDQQNAVQHNQKLVEQVWGKPIEHVEVDFADEQGQVFNYEQLKNKLAEFLPIIALINEHDNHSNNEEENFAKLKIEILSYAGVAAGTDLIPAIGLVTVPTIQAKMIHSLAKQYGIEWNKSILTGFIASLGGSFVVQYSATLGARQLQKLIPIYGQTVGAALSATISFGTTYAIGRAACYYLYHHQRGEEVSPQEMQKLYKQAFDLGKKVAGYEQNK